MGKPHASFHPPIKCSIRLFWRFADSSSPPRAHPWVKLNSWSEVLETPTPAPSRPGAAHDPVERIEGRLDGGVLLLCDHAANTLPESYRSLGLPPSQLERHIAYDIGAAWMTRRLAERLEAPAILSRFSRLLIDPNRGADDPTLVMRISDGDLIPGNARIDKAEIARRREAYWRPYRAAIAAKIEAMLAQAPPPAVISLHTFTPFWKTKARPWEIGVLWDSDPRLAKPLIAALALDGIVVGDNEPYDGALAGDTLDGEVTRRGLAGVLIETRQDLVARKDAAAAWADRLALILRPILSRPELHRVEFHQSRTGRHIRD
jgi:predicted N-formylglutamate amidohydrolase